ncbi:MAG: DUF6585 family protein [Ktedonobacteraceae bacterium]
MAQATYAYPNQQMPNEIYQQAATSDLGELFAIYKPKYANPLLIIGMALGGIIVDIVVTIIAYMSGWIVFYLYAVPVLILIWAIYTLASCNLRVYVFANGFINARGRRGEVIRWDQIQSIWEKVTRSSYRQSTLTYTYTVLRNDGKIFKQGSPLQKSRDMGLSMMREVVKIQLPLVKAAYQAGQTLAFGPINVDMQGVNNRKEMVPWDQIVRLTVSQGAVSVEQRGVQRQWSPVKSAEVPNLSVLMSLVNFVVQGQK